MKHAALLVSVTVIVAVVLGGCGGGSPSLTGGQAWVAYTPSSTVMPASAQQEFAATSVFDLPRTVENAAQQGDIWFLTYGNLQPVTNAIEMLVETEIQGLTGTLQVSGTHKASMADVVKLLAEAAAKGNGAAPAQTLPTFDWTDPDYSIHWTGSVVQNGDTYTPTIHGTGPNTDCTITVTITFSLGVGITLNATVDGQVAAPVSEVTDWTTQPITIATQDGRADAHGSVGISVITADLSTGQFNLSYNMAADFQLQEGASWATRHSEQDADTISGTWSDQGLSVDLAGTNYDGFWDGSGMFWGRHTLQGTLSDNAGGGLGLLGASTPVGSVEDQLLVSNGMTGLLQIDLASGDNGLDVTFSGWLKDKDGNELATISGTGDQTDPLTLTWTAGGSEVQQWLYQ